MFRFNPDLAMLLQAEGTASAIFLVHARAVDSQFWPNLEMVVTKRQNPAAACVNRTPFEGFWFVLSAGDSGSLSPSSDSFTVPLILFIDIDHSNPARPSLDTDIVFGFASRSSVGDAPNLQGLSLP